MYRKHFELRPLTPNSTRLASPRLEWSRAYGPAIKETGKAENDGRCKRHTQSRDNKNGRNCRSASTTADPQLHEFTNSPKIAQLQQKKGNNKKREGTWSWFGVKQ